MVDSALRVQAEIIASTLSIRRYSTSASLAIAAVEWLSTLPMEISVIWRTDMTSVKFLYLASRYIGLGYQSYNSYLIFGPLSRPPISHRWCKTWFGLSIAAGCISASLLDAVLMLRVYALHRKNPRIGLGLLGLLLFHTALSSWAAPGTLRHTSFDAICEPESGPMPPAAMAYSLSLILLHVVLGALTLKKRNGTRANALIVRVVTKEGVYTAALVCAMFAFLLPYSVVTQLPKSHVLFSWPITFFSVWCCRMIMKTQTMQPGTTDDADPSDVVLTTLRSTMILSDSDTHEVVESDIISESKYQE